MCTVMPQLYRCESHTESLVVLESTLGLKSIFVGLGLGHPETEAVFKSAYSCSNTYNSDI